MRFISTRGNSEPVTFSQALLDGLAPDGGLYVTEAFPQLDYPSIESPVEIIAPFLDGDPLLYHIENICYNAFNFDIPMQILDETTSILELFHGPTSAFKDVGARFLAECFSALSSEYPDLKKTILVATSGDTGGAVASAFYKKPNFDVNIFFPHQGVSERQEKQLTCWGDNIHSYAVKGNFDDCQKMVKKVLNSGDDKYSSANSINIGRLLPQMTYYAMASINMPGISYIVPTGNMGNVVAAFWAKNMGFPIDKIYLATNSNSTIKEYYETGEIKPQSTVKTLANAMDVGNPSNIERLQYLYPQIEVLKECSDVLVVSDEEIEKTIISIKEKYDYICCPHTATAMYFKQQLEGNWTIISTAHPAKFESVIEPIIKEEVPLPPELEGLLNRPNNFEILEQADDFLK